jgi:hypothetical protein
MSQTQQRIFAAGAQWNPDYFGQCAVGTLDNSALDLLAIVEPLAIPETVTRFEIADPGSSDWSVGQEVYPVTLSDRDNAAIPPRVVVRNRVVIGVGTDLVGVNSLRFYYSPAPRPLDPTDLAHHFDVQSPHDAVIPLDLTLYILDKIPSPTDAIVKGRASIAAEFEEAWQGLESHVRSYVMTTATRFGSRPHAPPMRQMAPQPTTK